MNPCTARTPGSPRTLAYRTGAARTPVVPGAPALPMGRAPWAGALAEGVAERHPCLRWRSLGVPRAVQEA
jgi:hypothetical protein